MSFKIWVQIEEIDEEHDHYKNVTEPIEIGRYEELKAAKEAMDKIIDAA